MGVTLMLLPGVGMSFAVAGMTSARGRSHTFDARADGYARGEACGAVTLHPSVEDRVLEVCGSAVRQDGRSASLTAPNGQAQQGLLMAALADARTGASALSLNEAHGTGTPLGDPIEVGSLVGAVLTQRDELAVGPLAVGGVKANIGHAEPAAGMTGLLKLALGLERGDAAPNAQLRSVNPHVRTWRGSKGSDSTFVLPSETMAAPLGGRASAGGESSFGYSGTIVHAVLCCTLSVRAPHASQRPPHTWLSFPWCETPHPFAQRHISSADNADVFRSPVEGVLHALVVEHLVQGRVIFPGAGYLEMARVTAAGAALHEVFFLQPLTLEASGLLIECSVADGFFKICSVSQTDDLPVHCSGSLIVANPWERVDHALVRVSACAHPAAAADLYDNFYRVGLQYGPSYRLLVQAWGSEDGAVGLLRTRPEKQGTQVHPADLDDALCTGALTSGSGRDLETRLPFAVEDTLLQGTVGKLWTVCHLLA
jgi:acyl transferase domain-containing protein